MGAYHLIVHNPFGSYQKGAHIRDATEVARVLTGANHRDVLRIAALEAPTTSAEATSAQGVHA